MLALRSAPPLIGTGEAERIARDVYGLALALTPLHGERDCNFRGRSADAREYVLKIVDGAAEPTTTDCLVRVLEHVEEQDPSLPVPRLLPTIDGAGLGKICHDGQIHSTCLMRYLPGKLLEDAPIDAPLLHRVGAALARLDRALQGFFHCALAQSIAWDVRRLPELADRAPQLAIPEIRRHVEAVCAAVRARLTSLRALRSQAIHGDCHAGNLLIEGDQVCGVIDFGDMIHGPRILEPAVVMSELLTAGLAAPEDLGAVVAGYAQHQPLEPGEIEALYDLVTGRHAVTLLLHSWRCRHDPRGALLLEAAAERAAASLDLLRARGRDALTVAWLDAAGVPTDAAAPIDLARRRRLLGAGAELFYDEPLHFVCGKGVWLYDREGRAYLDVYNNVPHVGHAHPAVVRAVQHQTARLATHTRYLHGGILDYAEALIARCPQHLDACLFVNSGSEANDVAWRMAQFATGHGGAVVAAHAYHGITDAVAALTPGSGEPQDPRVVAVPAPSVPSSEAAAAAARAVHTLAARGLAPAAFFIDSAFTSSGIFDPPSGWLDAVIEPLLEAGCLVVADEVQCGLGRCGSHFWGFERPGLTRPGLARPGLLPDIITLGKPIGNGYPLGAVIAPRALIESFQAKFGFFSTFGGNPVAAAAGLAVLAVLDREQLQANAATMGAYLRRHLLDVTARRPCLGEVRGAGLLIGVEVVGRDIAAAKARTREIVNRLASHDRVLIGSEGPSGNILKLRPPMVFGSADADLVVRAIDEAAAAIDARDG